jgi:hypothetical protein
VDQFSDSDDGCDNHNFFHRAACQESGGCLSEFILADEKVREKIRIDNDLGARGQVS